MTKIILTTVYKSFYEHILLVHRDKYLGVDLLSHMVYLIHKILQRVLQVVASFFISYWESKNILVAPHPNLHLIISG